MADPTYDADFLFSNFDSETATTEEIEDEQLLPVKSEMKKTKKSKRAENQDTDTDSQISAQNKYISELEQQNAKLKSIIKRMMGPQIFSSQDLQNLHNEATEIDLVQKLEDDIQSKPFAIVLFMNNDISTAHRKEVDNLMKEISAKDAKQEVLMAQKLQPQTSAVPLKAFSTNAKGRRCNPGKTNDIEEPYVVCACQYFKSFYLDRLGAPLLESNPDVADIWDVPAYPQVFFKALPIVEEALNVRVKQMKQCFNCGGEHHLNECPEPRDQARIRENREKFTSRAGPKFNLNLQSDELEERFKHFKPGVISVDLEEALGISLKDQVPPYIYKMRSLGYPPGWVRPIEDDGLKIYGVDGNVLEIIDYEEGEIKPINLPEIIQYPGFNAPLPTGVADEFDAIGMPRYNKLNADYDVRRKRAKILGYFENEKGEPVAKKLKYDDSESMDIENEGVDLVGGKPPLPLIDVTARPPLPDQDEADVEEADKQESIKKEMESSQDEVSDATNDESDGTGKEMESSSDDVKSKRHLSSSSKDIDETTYRHWYTEPFASVGLTYTMYTPPPLCQHEINLNDLPKNPVTDIDREPWKTSSVSWYFPLYGDLAAPTGTFDNIRTLLKDTKKKRPKKKPML